MVRIAGSAGSRSWGWRICSGCRSSLGGRRLRLARHFSGRHPELHRGVDDGRARSSRRRARAGRCHGAWSRPRSDRAGPDRRAGALPRLAATAADLVPRWRAADGLVPAVPLGGLAAHRGGARPRVGARQRDAAGRRRVRRDRVVGLVMLAVIGVRRYTPRFIHYPSDLVQQMGPETFFYRLGTIGPMALGAYIVTRVVGAALLDRCGFFGQTSLLVYWVHVELGYGLFSGRLHHGLTMTGATVGPVLMIGAMLVLAVLRTRYWRGLCRRGTTRAPRLPRRKGGNLPSAPRRL